MSRELEIRNALVAWALENGILATNLGEIGNEVGDPDILPFTAEHATYFRSRKIVRITVSEENEKTVFTIYSRLLIAKAKCEELIGEFNSAFEDENFRLRISESRPFKIDTSADDSAVPIRWHQNKIACGSSVGIGNQRNAGTLMALAKSKGDEDGIYGISCNHVVGGCNTARPGTPIVVPGILDVSTRNNQIYVIGEHDSTASMSQGLPSVFDISKNRDLACFRVRDANLLTSMQGEGPDAFDTPTSFAKAKKGMRVKKWGRSSGFTTGEISGINVEGESLPYDIISYFGPNMSQRFQGTVYFSEVIEVNPDQFDGFSKNGDSGALVVTNEANQTEKVVGIVIGGDKRKSYLLPLKPALDELKLNLLSGHNI